MKSEDFLKLGPTKGTPAAVTYEVAPGESRTVKLFFRGYKAPAGTTAPGLKDLVPVFSPQNKAGGMNRRIYKNITSIEQISRIAII